MSWYTKAFDNVRGIAAPAALAISTAAATLTGTVNQAIAQDISAVSLEEPRHEPLVKNALDVNEAAAREIARVISRDKDDQTLLLTVSSEEDLNRLLPEMQEAVLEALTRSDNELSWLVVGKNDDASNPSTIFFYTKGILNSTITNPTGADLNSRIVQILSKDLTTMNKVDEEIQLSQNDADSTFENSLN